MPQASDQLRAAMKKYFNDPVDCIGPIAYLKSKGWYVTKESFFLPPDILAGDWNRASKKEQDCIHFLFQEWDFGGVLWVTLEEYQERGIGDILREEQEKINEVQLRLVD